MANTLTLLDLEQQALNLLNEMYNSPAFDLRSGASSTATIAGLTTTGTTASTFKTWFNEAFAEAARTYLPIPDSATITWTNGVRTNRIADFTAGVAGQVMWAVRGLTYGGTQLLFARKHDVEITDQSSMSTAGGTPTYWYPDGNLSVGLYLVPTATTASTVIDGYAVPVPVTAATATLAWLPDNLARFPVYYVCLRATEKVQDDPTIKDRYKFWRTEYDDGRMKLWQAIDIETRQAFFPSPPVLATK